MVRVRGRGEFGFGLGFGLELEEPSRVRHRMLCLIHWVPIVSLALRFGIGLRVGPGLGPGLGPGQGQGTDPRSWAMPKRTLGLRWWGYIGCKCGSLGDWIHIRVLSTKVDLGGWDGRWGFDLHACASTIRRSSRPLCCASLPGSVYG